LKVLLVNSTFGRNTNGSGHHVYLLYKYLRNKVDFEVWNTSNVGYINIPKLKSVSFYLIMRLKSIPSDVDVIHVHNPKFSGLFKVKSNESKSVLTIHGDYVLEAALQYGLLSKPFPVPSYMLNMAHLHNQNLQRFIKRHSKKD